jgi:peroxisomal 3,2-trans-enoyl-CoA isomerase
MDSSDKKIITKLEKGVLTIRIDNQKKKNSLTSSMMRDLIIAMNDAIKDDQVKVVYVTSTGEFFSSGNDFNNFSEQTKDEAIDGFEKLISFLINYPKVLIAGVNGPAVGVSFTMLNFFDMVLCSDTAFFTVPFIQTFQTPEGCSTIAFPLYLGKSMSGHLLLNGGVMTAEEAKNLGFATAIYEKEFFDKDAYEYALKVATHPLKSLMKNKAMINKNFTKILMEVNSYEAKELRKSWDQPEFVNIIKKFVKNPKF